VPQHQGAQPRLAWEPSRPPGELPFSESLAGVAQSAEQSSGKQQRETPLSWLSIHMRVKFGTYLASTGGAGDVVGVLSGA
jgi:hypothetical protein